MNKLHSFFYTRLFRVAAFLMLIGIAVFQFHISLLKQADFSSTGGSASLIDNLQSPRLLTLHARQLYMFGGELDKANELFKRALSYNPLYLPGWLGLAEMRNDQGRREESDAIQDYVDRLSIFIYRWRWDKALLAYQLGRYDILSRDLSYIIENIPGKTKNKALKLAFSIWDEPQTLLEQIGRNNAIHLFRHAIVTKRVDKAIALWSTVEASSNSEINNDVIRFANVLLLNDKVAMAGILWRKYINPISLLYNGDFLEKPMNTAFGWRIQKPKGSNWRIEKYLKNGKASSKLRVHFSGIENVKFHHLYQIVLVEGGNAYVLKGEMKTERLTTDQRPFLEVYGFKCDAPYFKTDMVDEEQSWTYFFLTFQVPEMCDAVMVRLRRLPSKHLDNQISGDIWLRNLEIAATGEINTILDEQ